MAVYNFVGKADLYCKQSLSEILFEENKRISCGLFLIGKPTKTKLDNLRSVVEFMQKVYGVKRFYIESTYCKSEFTSIIYEVVKNAYIVVVTHFDEQRKSLAENYIELGDELVNFSAAVVGERLKKQNMAREMMKICRFCVTDLSESNPLSGYLKRYAENTKGVKIINIGK